MFSQDFKGFINDVNYLHYTRRDEQ